MPGKGENESQDRITYYVRSLTARPLSPEFQAVGEMETAHCPQQPLTAEPEYESDLHFVPLGPDDQYAVYKTKEDADRRSANFVRCGRPSYILRYIERASEYGCQCPSFFNSLTGRQVMMAHSAELEGVSEILGLKMTKEYY
jgi:hypothetical protein